jgi:hypothetical protein
MSDDLSVQLELDKSEPIYYGVPDYVANYPCLVSIPSDFVTNHIESPFIAEYRMQHRILYIFQSKRPKERGFIDHSIVAVTNGSLMLDWLAYATLNNIFPTRDLVEPATDSGNWLVHIYDRPWYLRVENEFETQFKQTRVEENLHGVLLEFETVSRWPFMQLIPTP